MLGLYIHIPFCNHLCTFCDFPKRIKQKEEYKKQYIEKLKMDILGLKQYNFDTIYIGGGTPNSLSLGDLEELLKTIATKVKNPVKEYTIETNYELITLDQIKLFKKYGINRVSMGVQTLDKEVGKKINKFVDKKVLLKAIEMLIDNGITNYNLDFMFGLPNQSLHSIHQDLKFICHLKPKHLSYYSLILEDKTVLKYQLEHNLVKIPDNDLADKMYQLVIKTLKKHGYHHYEISNFAQSGFESNHNMLYWNLEEYIGLGMSAASYFKKKRIYQSKLIDNYLLDKDITVENISVNEEKGEYFWLGLRLIDGVSLKKYQMKYHSDPFIDYPLDKLIQEGLLVIDNDKIKLTSFGLEHGNHVFSFFV